jgi:Tol biopolymer transport system component
MYVSNRNDRPEVWVRPYPGPGAPLQIAGDGATAPAWSRDGTRVFFVQLRDAELPLMMVVDVTSRDPFRVSRAVPFIDPWPYANPGVVRGYDLFPDGSFVAVAREGGGVAPRRLRRVSQLNVVLNFVAELRVRVPT